MELVRRPRRLRATQAIRDLVHETDLHVSDLIYPVFVVEGENIKEEIPSMPGIYHYSLDRFEEHLKEIADCGVRSIIFFGVPDHKDEVGSGAYDMDGIVQKALRLTKSLYPDMICIADICLCEYTSHGHCGVVDHGKILNDPTLTLLSKAAVSCAKSGADIVAPSDMMDGRIGHMRHALDEAGCQDTLIMAYSNAALDCLHFTARSARLQTALRPLATVNLIRWIGEIKRKPLWRRPWMWKKGRTF